MESWKCNTAVFCVTHTRGIWAGAFNRGGLLQSWITTKSGITMAMTVDRVCSFTCLFMSLVVTTDHISLHLQAYNLKSTWPCLQEHWWGMTSTHSLKTLGHVDGSRISVVGLCMCILGKSHSLKVNMCSMLCRCTTHAASDDTCPVVTGCYLLHNPDVFHLALI